METWRRGSIISLGILSIPSSDDVLTAQWSLNSQASYEYWNFLVPARQTLKFKIFTRYMGYKEHTLIEFLLEGFSVMDVECWAGEMTWRAGVPATRYEELNSDLSNHRECQVWLQVSCMWPQSWKVMKTGRLLRVVSHHQFQKRVISWYSGRLYLSE